MAPRVAVLVGLAVVIVTGARAPAQTTSARSDSLEVSRRADGLLSSGAHERAARLYQRALEIDATNQRAYVGLSAALDRQGKHRAALELLDDAQSRLGWTVELGLQRGIHLLRLDRWQESVATLNKVLKRQPDSYRAAYYSASSHMALAHWQQAIDGYSIYLAGRPEGPAAADTRVRNRRALAMLALGDHPKARDEVATVLTRDPNNRPARMLMFTALAKAGDCQPALELFTEIEELAATSPTLIYNAAVCEFRLGNSRAALARLDAHHRLAQPRAGEPLLRARIYAALDDSARATASYREAIAAGLPAAAEFAAWLAQRGEHSEAVALLWPLFEDGSRDPDQLLLTISTLRATSSHERALIAARRLVEVRPVAASWQLLGDIEVAGKAWSAAEAAYTRARELDPDNAAAAVGLSRALFERATVELRADHRAAAHALLERAHRTDPRATAITYNLALLELADRPRKTIELLTPDLDRIDDARAHLLIGRAYHAVGDDAAARRFITMVADAPRADTRLRALAIADLGHLLVASAPKLALVKLARARALGSAAAGSDLALGEAEARARLALAEQSYRRGDDRKLGPALARVTVASLPAAARTRARLLELYAHASSAGTTATLRKLAAIPDDDLSALNNGELPLASLRHALALIIVSPALRRPRDFTTRLRAHATALDKSRTAAALTDAWYDNVLASALASPAGHKLARALARNAPRASPSTSLRHNLIVAAALTRPADRRFTATQRRDLASLTPDLTEALVNLAIASEGRGHHTAALGYLGRIPAARRSPAISAWLRWKELLYGAP